MGNCLLRSANQNSDQVDQNETANLTEDTERSTEVTQQRRRRRQQQLPRQQRRQRPVLRIVDLTYDRLPMTESETQQLMILKMKSMLYHLPCREFKSNAKAECAICMDDYEIGEMIRYLPCFHSFHQRCIDDWLYRSFTCPSCLEPVGAALLLSFDLQH